MPLDGGLTLKEMALDHLRNLGGIAQLKEFASVRIPSVILRRMVSDGSIANPARGVYVLPGAEDDPYLDYAIEALSVPTSSRICLLTAAYMHGLVDVDPRELFLAIPRGVWPPKSVGRLPVTPLLWKGLGQDGYMEKPSGGYEPSTEIQLAGRLFYITSAAKTVSDLLVFRNSPAIGHAAALEAFGNALASGVATVEEIAAFAGQFGHGGEVETFLEGCGAAPGRPL